ncbi:MAG: hypothetical protein K5931_01970 [Lachnospiraceae bacterium]|nr:hypothetical protein [Lachnospiraceae bacterium]
MAAEEYDITKKSLDNDRAKEAKENASQREAFLADSKNHILRLTAKITGHVVTESDDEWSIALIATSEAIDSYESEKGNFWSYAAIVIKSRLTDMYRKQPDRNSEISVAPDAFEGNADENDSDLNIRLEIGDKIQAASFGVNNDLKDEIIALTTELKKYDIKMSELFDFSPKSYNTKGSCKKVVGAIFLPPPLVELLKKKKKLPIRDIIKRTDVSKKIIDRHRKYLMAVALILDGDYPNIREYVKDLES